MGAVIALPSSGRGGVVSIDGLGLGVAKKTLVLRLLLDDGGLVGTRAGTLRVSLKTVLRGTLLLGIGERGVRSRFFVGVLALLALEAVLAVVDLGLGAPLLLATLVVTSLVKTQNIPTRVGLLAMVLPITRCTVLTLRVKWLKILVPRSCLFCSTVFRTRLTRRVIPLRLLILSTPLLFPRERVLCTTVVMALRLLGRPLKRSNFLLRVRRCLLSEAPKTLSSLSLLTTVAGRLFLMVVRGSE